MQSNPDTIDQLFAQFLSRWVPISSLKRFVGQAADAKEPILVKKEENFRLWAFLRFVHVDTNDKGIARVFVNTEDLEGIAIDGTGRGFERDFDFGRDVSIEAQRVYQVFSTDLNVDPLRRYVNDKKVRSNLKALDVQVLRTRRAYKADD